MLQDYYLITKALHIISVMAWMAGMLYLPRLFVYHADMLVGSDSSELFKIMEKRLLRLIINPAMIASFVFGVLLVIQTDALQSGWFHTKILLLFLLFGVHGLLARHRRAFAEDRNTKSSRYYRLLNEVPTVLMIFIVLLVVIKPF